MQNTKFTTKEYIPHTVANKELWLILVAFLALAWAYGMVMGPFENLDEIEHFSAIRYVSKTGSLPVHDPVLQKQYFYRQEASQPPLYYILMAGATRLLGLSSDDMNVYLVSNPFVACGPSAHPYNKHGLYHNPSRDAFPWDGALLTLHVLRALTPLLQAFTVFGVYAVTRLVFPRRPQAAPLAAAITAFNPQFLSVASGVNNDNLVTPLTTLGLYMALLTHQRGLSWRRSVGLGIVAGLAALSKLSGLGLWALIGLVFLEIAWRRYRSEPPSGHSRWTTAATPILHGALIGVIAVAISGWWFWRNWQLYGDLTALQPMLKMVGLRGSPILPLNEFGLVFRSFWGQIACSFFSSRFYVLYSLLTAVGLVGLAWGLVRGDGKPTDRKTESSNRSALLFLILWFGIIFFSWLRWNMLTPAPGGRLLFPAIATISALLAYGLLRFFPVPWHTWGSRCLIVLLAVAALAALRWELYPFFAPPNVYDEDNIPTISHPLDATFGSEIALLGYDAEIVDDPLYLDVTLYLQAMAPLTRDYALAIQLSSPIPGNDSLRFNYNTWPGRGNYPTTAWVPNQIIADHYRFRLPESDTPTQAWHLLTIFYEYESGERLPVRVGGMDAGRHLVLTRLRLPGHAPTCPPDGRLSSDVRFGDAVRLTHAEVRPHAAGLTVTLCWEALQPLPADYTVFVHLLDAGGALVATGDGPPMDGAFPTSLWQPGDMVRDTHEIPTAELNPAHSIAVGLYHPEDGSRLPAVVANYAKPDNAVPVWPDLP
ncbi:MAG TPA: hypothetical protein ENN99_06810 [Chloroflexi bacterium]|nr:hypothetical protein [Chloroflexota bacterium]